MDQNVVQRKQLRAFADRMEQILTRNDDKGGWESCSPGWLMGRAEDELKEAKKAYKKYLTVPPRDLADTCTAIRLWQDEFVDMANFCMMAWDRLQKELDEQPAAKA